MRSARTSLSLVLLFLLAVPCAAGIHYQAVTKAQDASGRSTNIEVEGWVSGGSAKIVFRESGNPMFHEGAYLLTKDGGKTLYLVDPKEKTYAVWDLDAMVGMAGAMMQGMGPLLKVEVSDPKVEDLGSSDGGTLLARAGSDLRRPEHRTALAEARARDARGRSRREVRGRGTARPRPCGRARHPRSRLRGRSPPLRRRARPPRHACRGRLGPGR